MQTDNFYLFVCSSDSLKVHERNVGSDFIVQLPRTYYLDGKWECALIEASFVPDFEESTDQILICTDVIADSYVQNTSRRVLRRIEILREDKTDLSFNPGLYFDVKQTELSRLNIYVLDDKLQLAGFKVDKVNCTLHFRRKKL